MTRARAARAVRPLGIRSVRSRHITHQLRLLRASKLRFFGADIRRSSREPARPSLGRRAYGKLKTYSEVSRTWLSISYHDQPRCSLTAEPPVGSANAGRTIRHPKAGDRRYSSATSARFPPLGRAHGADSAQGRAGSGRPGHGRGAWNRDRELLRRAV